MVLTVWGLGVGFYLLQPNAQDEQSRVENKGTVTRFCVRACEMTMARGRFMAMEGEGPLPAWIREE